MEDKPSRKRQFFEDDDSNKQPMQKRVRFPKGKKVKAGDEVVLDRAIAVDDGPGDLHHPRRAAKERANRRNQMTFELFSEERDIKDISAAEVNYQDNENFEDDGIPIEPFNLNKEREEGYFDAQGNFVEYVNEKEIKDAWLDSIEVDPRYFGTAERNNKNNSDEDDSDELSPEDIAAIKRRIANVLEPEETVKQALKRLKGTSNNKKEKMSAETKLVFDQLTEDAMKLMEETGEYDVYNDKREIFVREAEGYERLAQAKRKGTSISAGMGNSDSNVTTAETSNNADDGYDMFGDEDENARARPSSNELNSVSGPYSNVVSQSSSDALNAASESISSLNDYVYDESSGYYYSSSLGYYYDPSTGLYCSATSGQWYSFNEETNTYEEVHEVASTVN